MKVSIQTLGCKVNQSESASIEAVLRNNDYEVVKQTEKADVCIINTCTVTAKSDYQSRQLIRRAVKSGARVIATGCYAQLRPEEASDIKGLDLIVGNSGKQKILSFLDNLNGKDNPVICIEEPVGPLKEQPYFSGRSRAFLKIQDGCNSSCSYCAVPEARGKSRSLGEGAVISAVNKLYADGYREVVLTGIHIGSYGQDVKPKSSLPSLIRKIAASKRDMRIRLSSLEPREFTDDFMQLINENKICPHIHIPLQSGSDRILREMNRGYSTAFYKQLINNIITAYPDISIGTDVIVGFPGESDKDFNDTVNFLKQLPLTYLHVFPYSKRPGTRASTLKNQISEPEKKNRVKKLIEISNKLKKAYMTRQLGDILHVIVENKSETNGFFNAVSDNYLRLFVESHNLKPRQSLRVRVTSLTEIGLCARPID